MSEALIKLVDSSAPKEEEIPTSLEKVSILVVDDLPEKLLSYEAILEDLGQTLVMARSGQEALKLVLKQEFAVILLDVNMPDMDGFETASLIRARKRSSHTPIIFLTAFTDELRMAQGYASGAVDYLPTPVVPETLKAKVRVFIELSQMRRRAALQAQESALRHAAEEAARRSEFLARASEMFTRASSEQAILNVVAQTPVPQVADTAIFWRYDKETRDTWVAWSSRSGGCGSYRKCGFALKDIDPQLQESIQQIVENGQPQYINHLPATGFSFLAQDNDMAFHVEQETTHFSALAVPFSIRLEMWGVLILLRSGKESAFQPSDLSLIMDFLGRGAGALENLLLLNHIKDADRRKNEFLAMLAHELRNPLAPMSNALYMLKNSAEPSVRQQVEETIDRQLKHMVHLVDDLMDISRITQGKIELRKQVIPLKDALDLAAETAQAIIHARGHTLNIQLPPEPVYLDADASRLAQIFANLLNNAAKYTDNGGRIEVGAQHLGDKVVIHVKDNGIGIPEHMISSIFEMFHQVDSSLERAQGGLGIGLTLVKSLVEMHGGSIEAKSKGEGSEFIVTLPTAAPPQLLATPVRPAPEERKDVAALKVLIVDDNIESAKTLGWMIGDVFGHQVQLGHDGKAALEYMQTATPDVVLLDIGLPGMNGYEVCKAMTELPTTKDTVFIAQTGWGQSEHRRRSQDAGFHYHLVKPVNIDELEKLLQQFTARHGAPAC